MSQDEERVQIAGIQSAFSDNLDECVSAMTELIRQGADAGAQIILMPELFEGHYFCQSQVEKELDRARSVENHPTLLHFQKLAEELQVVLPVSFYERDRNELYNSVAIVNADGAILGVYRKTHIPDGPGYQEKFYFRPGNSGFKSWQTRYARIGVGICWDQWFPECARAMALLGADLLMYPTAIGSEPHDASLDTREPWRRVMQGHAVANACPVLACNRVGSEGDIQFYGTSFICDHRGEILSELDDSETGLVRSSIDLKAVRRYRDSFGFFRDRRPELYRD